MFFLLLTLSQTGFVPDADNKACADVHPLHENEQANSPLAPNFGLGFLRILGWFIFSSLSFAEASDPRACSAFDNEYVTLSLETSSYLSSSYFS